MGTGSVKRNDGIICSIFIVYMTFVVRLRASAERKIISECDLNFASLIVVSAQ